MSRIYLSQNPLRRTVNLLRQCCGVNWHRKNTYTSGQKLKQKAFRTIVYFYMIYFKIREPNLASLINKQLKIVSAAVSDDPTVPLTLPYSKKLTFLTLMFLDPFLDV